MLENTFTGINWYLNVFISIIIFIYNSILYLLPQIIQVRHSTQLYFFVSRAKKAIGKRAFKFKAPADFQHLVSLSMPCLQTLNGLLFLSMKLTLIKPALYIWLYLVIHTHSTVYLLLAIWAT